MSATEPINVRPLGPRWEGYLLTRTAVMHGGANRLGNVVPFATEPVAVPGRGILEIPTVSGNSIRHGLREALAHLYLAQLRPILISPKFYYMIFSGGANQGGDGGHFDFDDRRETLDMVPPVAVFGTARDGGTFAGSVGVASAQPISRETWDLIGPPRPTSAWPCGVATAEALGLRVYGQKPSSALRMIAERQYTRVDALKHRTPEFVAGHIESAPVLAPVEDKPKKRGAGKGDDAPGPQQMIYSAQVLVRGLALHHALFFTQPPSPLVRAAFAAALRAWSDAPTIGGRAAIGHGLVDPIYDRPFDDDAPFFAYMRERRETIRRYLADKHGAIVDPARVAKYLEERRAREPQRDGEGEAQF